MTRTQVTVTVQETHAAITFATADGLNVLFPEALRSLGAAIARLKHDSRVRATVVQGEGKVFLAGADVKLMAQYTSEEAREYSRLGTEVMNDLAALPCITVAAIHGAALGAGFELAVACDFRIAVKSAKLGFPEVSLGLIPAWGGLHRLTKLVGPSRAKRMYLSGVPVSAEDSLAFGLVDEVVNSVEDLGVRVAAFCKMFRRASPAAVALAKRASRNLDDVSAFVDCFGSSESREGIAAFLEKRAASWME